MSSLEGGTQSHDVEVPITEPEGTPGDPFEPPKLADIKLAHIRLMRAYVSIMAASSRMEPPDRPFPDSLLRPFLVRRLVDRHLRLKFAELGTIYLQLGQAIYDEHAQSADPWLSGTSESCTAAAKRLPKWRLPGIAIITSLALPAAGLLSKIHRSGITLLAAILCTLVIIFLWLAFGAGRRAYIAKRELFLPAADKIDKEPTDKQRRAVTGNVYLLEDELYQALQRKKRRENQIDGLLIIWTACSAFYIAIIVNIIFNAPFYWLVAETAAFMIALSVLFLLFGRNRAWR